MQENQGSEAERAIDVAFGEWLRSKRELARLSAYKMEKYHGIHRNRVRTIEGGTAYVGARRAECATFATAYGLDLKEVLQRAAGVSPC